MDRISGLPDELLYCILSCLKLRDVVRLSIVSNRFKYICPSIHHLQFDWDNMLATDSWGESPCAKFKEKFVRGINQFLQFYYEDKKQIEISSFSVSCCLGFEYSNDIDHWVRFAISRGAQKLWLKLYCDKYCRNRVKDEIGELSEGKYLFSKKLFEGVQTSNLKELCLYGCLLEPNFSYQFSCLETLLFVKLPLCRYDLKGLFSCLLNLKGLTVFNCSLPTKLCLSGLTRLEKFVVVHSVGLEVVELSNPNLQALSWIARHRVACDLNGAPNLLKLCYLADKWTCPYLFTRLPQHFPRLRKLYVASWSNWVEWVPQTISIFNQVTELRLCLLQHPKFSILKIISILGAFPCLSTLDLTTCCPEDVDEGKLKPCEYFPNHLTEVVISGFYNTPKQMEFAIYLLKSAGVLRRLVIRQETRDVPKRQSWYEGESKMVYQRLQEFAKDGVLVVQ